MNKSWSDIIAELQAKGMTYAQIGESIGCAGSTVGDLASGRSQSPRASSALALLRLHVGRCGSDVGLALTQREAIGPLIDSRMSKRALRARLGLATDAHLAKVLQLPVEQVAAWPEERGVPALPQVMKLLGVQAEQPAAEAAQNDPDAERVIQVQVA